MTVRVCPYHLREFLEETKDQEVLERLKNTTVMITEPEHCDGVLTVE